MKPNRPSSPKTGKGGKPFAPKSPAAKPTSPKIKSASGGPKNLNPKPKPKVEAPKLKANSAAHRGKQRTEVTAPRTFAKDFDALSADALGNKPPARRTRSSGPNGPRGEEKASVPFSRPRPDGGKSTFKPLAPKYMPSKEREDIFAVNAKARMEGTGPEWVYEDNHILLAYKPVGMLSQGDESGEPSTLEWANAYLKRKYEKAGEAFIAPVHRLDRPVQGLQMLARTSKAATRLTQQFQDRTIEKIYYAITEETPEQEEGVLTHYLQKMAGTNIVRAYTRKKNAEMKEAQLWYRVRKVVGQRALLEIRPFTGRQHQIRVQLAKMGCGIVGDKKYTDTKFLPDKSIALFAQGLSFTHPTTGKKMRFELDFPDNAPWRNFFLNLD